MGEDRWFEITVATLATWRVTHLIAMEDGPGDLIVSMRKRFGDSFFGKLMDCFYCLSLWLAAPIACLLAETWRDWLMLWLALSGAACLLEKLCGSPLTIHRLTSPEGDEYDELLRHETRSDATTANHSTSVS
jgi:hypothetical protein